MPNRTVVMTEESEEWVELTDGPRKFIMTRRELSNLSHRISRIFTTVHPIKPPIDGSHPRGTQMAIQPIFEASVLRSPERHTGGNGDGATPAGPGEQRGQARRPQT